MRTASCGQLFDTPRQFNTETNKFTVSKILGRSRWVDRTPPKHLVAEQVSQAGDERLIQQDRLDRLPAPCDDRAQYGPVQRLGIWPEAALVRCHLDRTQPTLVANGNAGIKLQDRPVPCGIVSRRTVLELIDWTLVVDQQTAGHSEPQAHLSGFAVLSSEFEYQELAMSPCSRENTPEQVAEGIDTRSWRSNERLGSNRHRAKFLSNYRIERPTVVLDFDKFRHSRDRSAN